MLEQSNLEDTQKVLEDNKNIMLREIVRCSKQIMVASGEKNLMLEKKTPICRSKLKINCRC